MPQDYSEAAKWSHKAEEQGHAVAQCNLGLLYWRGEGVPKDYVQAYRFLDEAAAREFVEAIEPREAVKSQMTPEQMAKAQRLPRTPHPQQ